MAKASFILLPLLLSIFYVDLAAESLGKSTNFIEASCSATRYPVLCVQSLSSYASTIQQSPRQLAQTALTVSITKAQSTCTFVSRMAKAKGIRRREYGAVKDCLYEMDDSVERLSRSVRELKRMGGAHGEEFKWHVSNVETWVSAALTDETTCMDGFSGRALDGKVKTAIRARVFRVAQVTSNALALVNQYASTH